MKHVMGKEYDDMSTEYHRVPNNAVKILIFTRLYDASSDTSLQQTIMKNASWNTAVAVSSI